MWGKESLRSLTIRQILRRFSPRMKLIRIMDGWRHYGFNIFCGERIHPREKRSLENLAAYVVSASLFQERREYFPWGVKVTYMLHDDLLDTQSSFVS